MTREDTAGHEARAGDTVANGSDEVTTRPRLVTVAVVGLLLLEIVVGWLSVHLSPQGTHVAAFWPDSGLSVIALCLAPPRAPADRAGRDLPGDRAGQPARRAGRRRQPRLRGGQRRRGRRGDADPHRRAAPPARAGVARGLRPPRGCCGGRRPGRRRARRGRGRGRRGRQLPAHGPRPVLLAQRLAAGAGPPGAAAARRAAAAPRPAGVLGPVGPARAQRARRLRPRPAAAAGLPAAAGAGLGRSPAPGARGGGAGPGGLGRDDGDVDHRSGSLRRVRTRRRAGPGDRRHPDADPGRGDDARGPAAGPGPRPPADRGGPADSTATTWSATSWPPPPAPPSWAPT